MAIGERIRYFRLRRGMTQKQLGESVGFPASNADVRLAQYETGTRKPKAELTAALAQVLQVSPHALAVPEIDSYAGLMHTLFALEDLYGLTVRETDGEVCLCVDPRKSRDAAELHRLLTVWLQKAEQCRAGEIPQEQYDRWRYCYPALDNSQPWVKVLPQEIGDSLREKGE